MSWVITGSEKTPVDPQFGSVSLLMHGEGSTIVDSSPLPKTVIAFGNATTSSTEQKFGSKSIAFDGSGDYLSIDSVDAFRFLTGDFTIEWWQKLAALDASYSLLSWRSGVSVLRTGSSGLQLYSVGGAVGVINIAATAVFTLGWQHVACVRQSNVVTFYVGGNSLSNNYANTSPGAIFNEQSGIQIGSSNVYGSFNGYIDDLRITKGIARYTANFTPPTAAFPDI